MRPNYGEEDVHIDMKENRLPMKNERFEMIMNKQFPPPHEDPIPSTQNKLMDLVLHDAIQQGYIDNFISKLDQACTDKHLPVSTIIDQVSPSGDTFLHVAAAYGSDDIASLVAFYFEELLSKQNIKGDTPLHLATRANKLSSVRILLYCGQKYGGLGLTRIRNHYGNTALHEAVIKGFDEMVQYLYLADQPVAHILNKNRESPMYLIALTSKRTILSDMLRAPIEVKELSEWCAGNSPLFVALCSGDIEIVKKVLATNRKIFEIPDQDGSTPVHWAAAVKGNWAVKLGGRAGQVGAEAQKFIREINPTAEFAMNIYGSALLRWAAEILGVSVDEMGTKVRNMIREVNPKAALAKNKEGNLPIHIACKTGQLHLVKEFLTNQPEWNDPSQLLNNEGQNILHLAAKYGHEHIVWYIKRNPQLVSLFDAKDNDGNTPLHLATINENPKLVFALLWDANVNYDLTNNQRLKPIDLIFHEMPAPLTTRQMITSMVLRSVSTPDPSIFSSWLQRWAEPKKNLIKDNVNILLVIATVIATVAFAAGFTMPGGTNQASDTDPGLPFFHKKKLFHIFIFSDSVALYASITSVILTLLCSAVPDYYLGSTAIALIVVLLIVAVFMMSFAFMAAIKLVVAKTVWLGNFIVFLETIFLSAVILPLFVLSSPYRANKGFMRYIHYYIVINVMMAISGSFISLADKKKQQNQQDQKSDPS